MKGDFTRFTFRPKKHYRNVNHQQGRVGLDADWNEQAEITAYRAETEARDVIGPCGAPKHNAGFAITAPGNGSDFSIGKGRYYVDGILCENESDVAFTHQPDLPQAAYPPAAGRHLVYLDVWQRHLTALDDPEIREVALGGPDTATRTKTVWQVRTRRVGDADAAVDCFSEPQSWKDDIAASTIELTARVAKEKPSNKPCIVPPGAGYRRLENQLYRVEIHRAGNVNDADQTKVTTFKWSRDNGSVAASIEKIAVGTITLTSTGRNHAVGLAEGQWIELLDDRNDWNRTPGVLVPITKVDDLVLTVDRAQAIAPPGGSLVQFVAALDQKFHPQVRRWDLAGVAAAMIPGTNDGFLELEDGVEVKFKNGTCRTGDYWLIPARTAEEYVEWPHDSASPPNPLSQAPHGILHHFCRLAIIEVDAGGDLSLVDDCRPIFQPLTEIDDACGCCTKTVGTTAAADYRLIQDAINSLPKAGGHICVLDGDYSENITIFHRRNITISGCGERTRITSGAAVETSSGKPVIWIANSTDIRIESLSLIADKSGNGVLVQREMPIEKTSHPEFTDHPEVAGHPSAARLTAVHVAPKTRGIWLTQLAIRAEMESAIEVRESNSVTVRHCRVRMADPGGAAPGIFLQGDEALIERNTITQFFEDDASYGVSGIQIGGGSRGVHVLENEITGMTGQGITLGSLEETDDENTPPRVVVGRPKKPADPCDKCAEPATKIRFQFRDSKGREKQHRSPDPLENIYLERNRISQTGLDGIGVIGFFDLREVDEFVSVRGLTVSGNHIHGCLRRAPANIEAAMATQMGYGGISLADVTELVIHDNVIEHNGLKHAQPVCGVFVAHGEGIDISRNRILGNGETLSERLHGPRGGVYIAKAVAPVLSRTQAAVLGSRFASFRVPEAIGFPALKVHDNIISTPLGRALTVVALGPVSIVGNQLTSGAVVRQEKPTLLDAAATVLIFDLGVSSELYLQARSFATLHRQTIRESAMRVPGPEARLVNGNVLFANNQCSLDLLESGQGFAFTSITILSLDDVAFQDNQCDCNLMLRQDFILMQALVIGFSLRFTGNRLKEGVLNAPLSAMTLGLLNTTAHNQATHCLVILGLIVTDTPNGILIELLIRDFCSKSLREITGRFFDLRRTTADTSNK